MNQPITAVQTATMRSNGTQSFLITIRAVEPKQERTEAEVPKSCSRAFPDDSMSDKQRSLIIQLISRQFWDSKEREAEFAKIAGFSRSDADGYIKSLINK